MSSQRGQSEGALILRTTSTTEPVPVPVPACTGPVPAPVPVPVPVEVPFYEFPREPPQGGTLEERDMPRTVHDIQPN